MPLAKTTPKILAYKVLGRTTDEEWADWAIDMLRAGYETENLLILAGESPPFNQFYMIELTDKVLKELGLDYSNPDKTIIDYVYYLVKLGITGEIGNKDVIDKIINVDDQLNRMDYLSDFRILLWAIDDLKYADEQYYWPGANRDNIDQITLDFLKKCAAEYESNADSFDGNN